MPGQRSQKGPRKEEIMRMRCTSMALCLLLVLSLSARHAHGATTARVTPSKTVSLEVQGADVRDVLRLLADTGGINILIRGDVQGTVTTRLLDVPWEQALDAILQLTGLAQERRGNMILVGPAEILRGARQERVQAHQVAAQTE